MYSEIRKAIEGYKNRQSYAFCLHLCFMTQFETSKRTSIMYNYCQSKLISEYYVQLSKLISRLCGLCKYEKQ